MKTTTTVPCDQCPFRRASIRGWLGPWDVEGLLWHLGRGTFPCHKTITSNDQPLETTSGCAGAAIFLNNKVEWSRNEVTQEHQAFVMHAATKEIKASVFANGNEFRAHHGRILPNRHVLGRNLNKHVLGKNRR